MSRPLAEFIELLGDAKSAQLFGVEKRTIQAWRRGERRPNVQFSKIILQKTRRHRFGPVAYDTEMVHRVK